MIQVEGSPVSFLDPRDPTTPMPLPETSGRIAPLPTPSTKCFWALLRHGVAEQAGVLYAQGSATCAGLLRRSKGCERGHDDAECRRNQRLWVERDTLRGLPGLLLKVARCRCPTQPPVHSLPPVEGTLLPELAADGVGELADVAHTFRAAGRGGVETKSTSRKLPVPVCALRAPALLGRRGEDAFCSIIVASMRSCRSLGP
jgi:hypothetical protein